MSTYPDFEFTHLQTVEQEYHPAPLAKELAAAEEGLAKRVRVLRGEEATELLAIRSFESEAAEWAMRASRAKKRLEAVRNELTELGAE